MQVLVSVLRIGIRIQIQIYRIHMFLGLLDPDPDPLVTSMDPDPALIRILQSLSENTKKNLDSTVL
jgi:hypothetical protein